MARAHPRSRRGLVGLLTDEIFGRVGGFMLGNLLTSLISGVGTYAWLVIFGVPYALLLGLFVAFFDLIPMAGSTIAGVVVSLVALSKGLPTGIATAVFYVAYRFLEDYLLNPRVMKHTVNVTPGLSIIATLVVGVLLGLIGALVAIPVAATVQLLLEEVTSASEPAVKGLVPISAPDRWRSGRTWRSHQRLVSALTDKALTTDRGAATYRSNMTLSVYDDRRQTQR